MQICTVQHWNKMNIDVLVLVFHTKMTKNIYGERDVVRFKQKHCNNFKERRKKRNWKRTRVRLYSPGNASRKIMRVEENGRETGDIYTWANYPASRAGIFSSSKLDDNSSAGGSWIPGYHSRVTMVSPSPFHPFSLSLSLSLSRHVAPIRWKLKRCLSHLRRC